MTTETLVFDIYKIPTEGMSQEAYDRMQDRGNGVNAALYAPKGTKPIARVAVTQSKRLESIADMAHSAAFEYASVDQFETQTCSRLSPDQTSDSDIGVDLSL